MTADLQALRVRLSAIDDQILGLAAERAALARQIGQAKQATGRATRDHTREATVLERARDRASDLGLPPDLAEQLLRPLIDTALAVQEGDVLAATGEGHGRAALVIGGSGKMGAWFSRFLTAQGYAVSVADPVAPATQVRHARDWQHLDLTHELVVVATPLASTNATLHALAERRPTGVVFDVASLKSPIQSGLQALVEAGVRVTSAHPMFGPDTRLLSGRHVIFCDCGDPASTEVVERLFAPTMARRVRLSLDEHDRAIAWVLGLSHALNIAFFTALARSGKDVPGLASLSSTTFDAQLDLARRVSRESPELYYAIQALNAHGDHALRALEDAVSAVCDSVRRRDEPAFIGLFEAGRAALDDRTRPAAPVAAG